MSKVSSLRYTKYDPITTFLSPSLFSPRREVRESMRERWKMLKVRDAYFSLTNYSVYQLSSVSFFFSTGHGINENFINIRYVLSPIIISLLH